MIHWIASFCGSDAVLQGGLLLGMFVTGVVGSIVHCGPMCGGFVLGQVSERMVRLPSERLCEWRRVGNGVLLPYHLGRLTTYCGLGAAAAGLGQLAYSRDVSAAFLTLAAVLCLAYAASRTFSLGSPAVGAPRLLTRAVRVVSRRIPRGSMFSEYLLGLALGFLPCGLLYAAIAVAAGSGRPELGAAALLAFGLGTTLMLMVIGVAGYAAGARWQHGVAVAAPVLMALNAVLLLILAWRHVT